jgi:hypothetical protein
MKYILFILSFIVIFSSCSTDVENPEIIISPDSMAIILADVHLADATLSVLMNRKRFTKIDDYYYSVLKKYNISRTRLDSSISYYSSRGKEFDKIYEDVMFILREKEGLAVAEKDSTSNKEIKKVKKYELVLSYKSNFEDKSENKLLDKKSSIKAKSGKFSVLFDYNTFKSNEFIYNLKYSISEIKIVTKASVSLMANKTKTAPAIVLEVVNGEKIEYQSAINIKRYIVKKQEWSNIDIKNNISLPASIDEGQIKVYISNPYKNDFFVDDFEIKLYVR